MKEGKKKNLVLLEKDGHTIVINGKKNDIYTLPSHGLAMIIKQININLGQYFKSHNESCFNAKISSVYAFVGMFSSLMAGNYRGDFATLILSSSLALSTAGIIKAFESLIKDSKARKEIKRYSYIKKKLGKEIEMRMMYNYKKENVDLTAEILGEATQVLEDYYLSEVN